MQTQDLSYFLNNEHVKASIKEHRIDVSMEVFSLENIYTIPNGSFLKNGESYSSNCLVWGDTEKVKGSASLDFKNDKNTLKINASASLDKKIRSIKIRFDNVPLGKLISLTSNDKDVTEYGLTFRYPEGWRDLAHPLLVFELSDKKYLYFRCIDKTVNSKIFYLKKIGNSMRVDIVQEQDGTLVSNNFSIPEIEIGIVEDKKEIFKKQQEYIEKTFDIVPFEKSAITPDWLKDISLVVIMHMEAFTGHIFHTYEKAYEDVKKLTELIPGKNILVYFAGWEGRYYYKYGNYCPDDRLGGADALKECIEKIHDLGCKTISMVGMNIVNKTIPCIKKIYKKAEFETISGGKFHNGSVDWEGAHHYDFGDHANLNIANKKWANLLFKQVKNFTLAYDFDGVFLDIAACFVNDKNNSLYQGLCDFCDELRTIKPEFLVSGEGYYDGLSKAMPLFQSGHTDGSMNYHDRVDEDLFGTYSREFSHLCLGDPSRGSSGVHELGTNTDWKTPYRKSLIPTISLVEDSLESAPEKVKEIINDAIKYSKEFCRK